MQLPLKGTQWLWTQNYIYWWHWEWSKMTYALQWECSSIFLHNFHEISLNVVHINDVIMKLHCFENPVYTRMVKIIQGVIGSYI